MKAALLKGPGRIEIAESPEPVCPSDGLILEIKACGLCGGDVRAYSFGNSVPGGAEIMGHEITGVVSQVGREARGYLPGDRLAFAADIRCGGCHYCRSGLPNLCENLQILGKHVNGGFVERMTVTAEVLRHGIVNPLPDDLSFVQGALSEPFCSILSSHDYLGVGFGQTVVVIGAGPMGCLHAALAKVRGAFAVILSEKSPGRIEVAKKALTGLGIEAFINPDEVDLEDFIRESTHGLGADVAIVACAVPEMAGAAVRMVKKRGVVGIFGGFPEGRDQLKIDGNILHYGEIRIVGNFSYHPSYHRLSLQALAGRIINPDRFITVYPLAQLGQAVLDAREGRILKAVLVP